MIDILLDEFMFGSLWNGGIFLFLAFTAIIYLFMLPHDERHSIWKTILFFLGLIVIFISVGSPINLIARIQFSTHIIQILLLLLLAPPLLILGFKQKPVDYVLSKFPQVKKITDFIVKPVFTYPLFFILFYGYHIPAIFDFARMDLFLNYFYLLALFLAAILLWLSLILQRKNSLIFVNILLLLPLSIVLLFVKDSLYTTYTDMSSFITAMELCLPAGQSLPPEYYSLLLPFDPVAEQVKGGWLFFVSQIIIYSMTWMINKLIKK